MIVSVPRALEGELRIDNMEFEPALSDPSTRAYRKMKADLEEYLTDALFTQQALRYGAADISVKVVDLRYLPTLPQH